MKNSSWQSPFTDHSELREELFSMRRNTGLVAHQETSLRVSRRVQWLSVLHTFNWGIMIRFIYEEIFQGQSENFHKSCLKTKNLRFIFITQFIYLPNTSILLNFLRLENSNNHSRHISIMKIRIRRMIMRYILFWGYGLL